MLRWLSDKQHEIVLDIAKGDSNVYAIVGAVGSGKTFAGLQGFIIWSQGYRGHTFLLSAKTFMLTRTVLADQLLAGLELLGLGYEWDAERRGYRVGDNLYVLAGGNDASSFARIQGMNLAGAFLDEIVNMPQKYVREVDNRVRSIERGKMVHTMNPVGPAHWYKRDWIDRADDIGVSVHHLMQNDNPSLSDTTRKRMAATSKGGFYKQRILGEWASPTGLVYPRYVTSDLRVAPKGLRRAIAIDPADSGVTHALLLVELEYMSWLVLDEWRYDGGEGQLSHRRQVDAIWQALGYCDILVYDAAAAAFGLECRERWASVYSSVKADFMGTVQDTMMALNTGIVQIGNVPELRAELDSYEWDELRAAAGEDRPVKGTSHGCDALRYFVSTAL